MRVAAIFGPAASEHHLVRFAAPCVELCVVPELSCGERYDAVLVFGGDGTVHRQLRVLHESKMPLLVIPVGSGNDLARELGLHTIRQAWRAWRRFCAGAGNVREIDLGTIRPVAARHLSASEAGPVGGDAGATFFTCIAGTGMDSAANRRANLMTSWWRAHGGYVFAALREIATWKSVRIRVSAQKSSTTVTYGTSSHTERRKCLYPRSLGGVAPPGLLTRFGRLPSADALG
jgi:diacylglycerol kinase family enzyme